MLLGGLCFVAGSALLASARAWAQLVVGRLVLGLGVGLATMATPLYLAEMAPAQYRGKRGRGEGGLHAGVDTGWYQGGVV